MLKRSIVVAVALAVTGAVAWANFPSLRTTTAAFWNSQTGWSEADRQADPDGFITYVEGKMRDDLALMQKTRRELAAEVGDLSRAKREQSAMATQAQTLAEEFRDEYQEALTNDAFPIAVRGEAYTETQVRSQVSLLLAEAEGYSGSLAEIECVQAEAEQKMEELAVRIGQTESQLVALATKRELLRVRRLTTEGEILLAQVDELMAGNTQAIAGNPVRTVRELADAEWSKPTGRVTNSRVEQFLAQTLSEKPEASDSVDNDTVLATPTSHQSQAPVQIVPQSKQRPRSKAKPERQKPIFQQS
jgi:hypothetical protein